jgi:hypothetical protein
MEYFTRLGYLFFAVGIAELSNKMVSQATSDRVFDIKTLYFRVVILLISRDSIFENALTVLHH